MSKLSFRARALDASKPLPVFRCEDLPDLHEYASINRAVPQMPTGMEKEEESVCYPAGRRVCGGEPRMSVGGFAAAAAQLLRNGRHFCRPAHTTDLGEYRRQPLRRGSRRVMRAPGGGILLRICVLTVYCPVIGARMHKEVTWPSSAPPFCWLSLGSASVERASCAAEHQPPGGAPPPYLRARTGAPMSFLWGSCRALTYSYVGSSGAFTCPEFMW